MRGCIRGNIELIAPITIEDGLWFAIREGGRIVGADVVLDRKKSTIGGSLVRHYEEQESL